jgi:hypothetical protein
MTPLVPRSANNYNVVSTDEADIDIHQLGSPSEESKQAFVKPHMYPVNNNNNDPQNLVKWSVDWKNPLKMTALLLAGGALAVGHHLFYQSLAGKPVENNNNENSWSSRNQQSNVRYGTAFAFATKTCLAAAVTFAYQQQIWISLRKKYLKISTLDAMFQATNDPFSFTNKEFISKSKLGAVLAAVIWYGSLKSIKILARSSLLVDSLTVIFRLLPLSALVTPAALTVTLHTTVSASTMPVPAINFSALNTFTSQGRVDMTSSVVKRITTAVVSGAQILNMPVFKPDSSYTTTFNGTSLQCSPANATIQPIIDGVFHAVNSRYSVYTAFSPFTQSRARWPSVDSGGSFNGNWSNIWTGNFTDWTSSCAADCILGEYPCLYASMATDYSPTFPVWYPLWLRLGEDRLVCSLQHTEYTVEFKAVGDIQTINFPISSKLLGEVTKYDYYVPMIQPLLDILTGGAYLSVNRCSKGQAQETHCTSNAILKVAKTSIQETALVGPFTRAAADVFTQASNFSTANNFPIQESPPTLGPGELELARNMSIGPLIEELSRNLTLSLFSNNIFL